MKRFLIMPNRTREKTEDLLNKTLRHLESRGCAWIIAEAGEDPVQEEADILLFIGGDGTMLRSAHTALRRDIPLAGIDAGCVGYYSRIKADEIEEKLDRLITGRYSEELCTVLTCDGKTPIINDAVAMVKGGVAGFLVVRKNGRVIYSTVSSGIILSATVGSTGISLSAGGAVLENGMDVMEITPILPNRGMKHSIVVSLDSSVELSCTAETEIRFDGMPAETSETALELYRFEKKLRMVSFES